MPSRSDLLLGQIALDKGFITKEQLDECVRLQESSKDTDAAKHLGILLLEMKYLDDEELEIALQIQRQKLNESIDNSDLKLKDLLIGQIAMNLKMVMKSQVDECLREQAKIEDLGIFLRIGEILIKKGYISEDQLEDILSYQKNLMDTFKADVFPDGGGADE